MSRKLKALRIAKGLSQSDMAKILGIGLTTYNKKEQGKIPFSLPEAKYIADIFGATIDEIFFNYEVVDLITRSTQKHTF